MGLTPFPYDLVLKLAKAAGAEAFVETGTFHGATAAWAAEHFRVVHTIELGKCSHNMVASAMLTARRNVVCHQGDSRQVLRSVLDAVSMRKVFWLDGHWSGEGTDGEQDQCPLLGELGFLTNEDVILIDDARLFMAPVPAPLNPEQWPSFDEVLRALPSGMAVEVIGDVIFAVPPSCAETLREGLKAPLVPRPRATHSQAQQDVILASLFSKIGTTNKHCVEFGFNADTLEGGTGSNAARLVLEDGWTGTFFDREHQNPAIRLFRAALTPENLGSVFVGHDVPMEPDYVSIDVDSIDLWLMKAMLGAGYRPRVISVEYNSNHGIAASVTAQPGTMWNGDQCYGASLLALWRLARASGYVLADVEPGLDLFFVREDAWQGPALSLLDCVKHTNLYAHAEPAPGREAEIMMEYQ